MSLLESIMRTSLRFVLSLVALMVFAGLALAEDAKATKLTGTLTCAKCQLKEAPKCQNALQVKQGDKTTLYYLTDNEVSKKAHHACCKSAKENVSVTGTIEEKDGKQWITATKIDGIEDSKG